jgi:excisionase family DNA binding protein
MIPVEMLTYPEAAERYRCDEKSIRRAIDAGKIEAFKPGRSVLIDRKSADEWFLSTRKKPSARMGRPRKGARR